MAAASIGSCNEDNTTSTFSDDPPRSTNAAVPVVFVPLNMAPKYATVELGFTVAVVAGAAVVVTAALAGNTVMRAFIQNWFSEK